MRPLYAAACLDSRTLNFSCFNSFLVQERPAASLPRPLSRRCCETRTLVSRPTFIALLDQTLNGLVEEAQTRPHAAVEKQPRESVLKLSRGSSTNVVRDGRPEAPYSSDAPRQDGIVREPAPSRDELRMRSSFRPRSMPSPLAHLESF